MITASDSHYTHAFNASANVFIVNTIKYFIFELNMRTNVRFKNTDVDFVRIEFVKSNSLNQQNLKFQS